MKDADNEIMPGPSSHNALIDATRSRARFSGHGAAKGAAGFRSAQDGEAGAFLTRPGSTAIVNPQAHAFGKMRIGLAWDNITPPRPPKAPPMARLWKRLLTKDKPSPVHGIDLDLGCLYELQDGTRGCVQAFGNLFGTFEDAPFIRLSGDERTGDAAGDDEMLTINGAQWGAIKRLLIYIYIYRGAPNWDYVRPQVQIHVPGEDPVIVNPDASCAQLAVCALATMENVRGGIRLTHISEYFPGHAEMDRAFGFGLSWADGRKS